jgi:NhaP-type Na+/H+ or K+/H+ antiporter
VILLLGSMVTLTGLGLPGWEGWLLAALVLVAVRPLACVAALAGSQVERPREKTFVAWFGVRGVGSLFYVATAAGAGVLEAGERDLLVWTVIACVLLSIVVHGITAGPSMRRMLRPQPARRRPPRTARR